MIYLYYIINGGTAEIRTQVARPPDAQDGPSYPTVPYIKCS